VSVVKLRTPANGALEAGLKKGPDKIVNAWEQGATATHRRTAANLKTFGKVSGSIEQLLVFIFFVLNCVFI